MPGKTRLLAVLTSMALAFTACTGGGNPAQTPSTAGPSIPRGGTLHVVAWGFFPDTMDPKAYDLATWEIDRCCLLRTLMSYNGKPSDMGGAQVHPDLAAGMPHVSTDGLTWTFKIKPGIHYAPPFQSTEITTGDFVRALRRAAEAQAIGSPFYRDYSFYFSVIAGFADVADGNAQSISGLETPDAHTLVVRLTQPTGDLGYRFALPATAPIPPSPADVNAPLGAAQGHDKDWGRFLAASGPYMYEGSSDLDLSIPSAEQTPVRGFTPPTFTKAGFQVGSVTLVRNPDWDRSTDPLRPAYPDRIEILLGPADDFKTTLARVQRGIAAGTWDVGLGIDLTPKLERTLGGDPAITSEAHTFQIDEFEYIAMNLAIPPFDDVHVRKAFSLALNKEDLVRRSGSLGGLPSFAGVVARHLLPDPLEGDLLAEWRPSWDTAPDGGDVAAARAQMRRSNYDTDGNGLCDVSACDHAVFAVDRPWPRRLLPPMRDALQAIGIRFNLRRVPRNYYAAGTDPTKHIALSANRWFTDYPNGSNVFPPLFYGPNLSSISPGSQDPSLLGATPEQLAAWGYSVASVPTADDAIDRCTGLIGGAQVECWAKLDQSLMETVVPWIPWMFQTETRLVSSRVVSYSFDQFANEPALDQIALAPGSS